MFKTLLSCAICCVAFLSGLNAQTILEENFETGSMPTGWTQTSNASDGGWQFGTPASISSGNYAIDANGSSNIVGTNDDGCNCNKSADLLISPSMDFSGYAGITLDFDAFYSNQTYEGSTETLHIQVSTNGGSSWTQVAEIGNETGWATRTVDLSAYAGMSDVNVGFLYNDGSGWLYGAGLDNVKISVPLALDAEALALKMAPFAEIGTGVTVKGSIRNNGSTPITSLEMTYSVTGEGTVTENLTGLNIAPFSTSEFSLPTMWNPTTEGMVTLDLAIANVNGSADEDLTNNSASIGIQVYPAVVRPNIIDDFLLGVPVYSDINTPLSDLDNPTDLDFFPMLGKYELWVLSARDENSGSSTTIYSDAGKGTQTEIMKVDGNAWHFMSLATAISFGDNGNFATSPGVLDANHQGGTFTGPTLWSSDLSIYAEPSGGNGSHLDMLHGSPYSMGITHEVDNVYWVFDGYNGTIVRYDFQEDHGPGNDYHGDALVRRYTEVSVARDGDVPSHLSLDKTTGQLYIVDNGNDRVLRLDINSGSVANELPEINETLAEHSAMGGVDWEVIINSGLVRPSGIEVFENRLLVSDYDNGDIIVYDLDNNYAELGRIQTGAMGITGIKIGPAGNIWYTNKLNNTVTKIEPQLGVGIHDVIQNATMNITPNPTTGQFNITLPNATSWDIEVLDIQGKTVLTVNDFNAEKTLDLTTFSSGVYMLRATNGTDTFVDKVVLQK